MTSIPDTQPLTLGTVVLDRYRVVEHVAAGGHSVVYRGQDERLSRPVCIKVFSRLPSEQGVSRASYEHFVQEAFALSRLTHPNTLRIYDFGHVTVEREEKKGEVPFQVCEFMNGGTLAQVVRDHGPQTPVETLRVIGSMCDALAEAHGLGIIHRDIKPQNILFAMVGATRLPKLADFGIAKWTDDEPSGGEKRAGDTQVVAGHKMAMYSPSWAAPEQLSGQRVSAATDIYSLAVVTVYTLTGNPIFACDDVYEGYKRRRNPRALLDEAFMASDVPREAIDVLARALAFAPEDRLPRVADLVNQLLDAFEPSTVEHQKTGAKDPVHAHTTQSLVGHSYPLPEAPLAAGSTGPGVRRANASNPPPLPPPTARGTKPSSVPPMNAAGQQSDVRRTNVGMAVSPPPGAPSLPNPGPAPIAPAPAASSVTPAAGTPIAAVPPALAPVGPSGPPRRVNVSPTPIAVADRIAHFAQVVQGAADIADAAAGVRVRVTLMPSIGGRRAIHLKSLSSFIAFAGGRPTSAIQMHGDGEFDLVSPGQQVLAKARLSLGGPAAGHTVFQVGHEAVALVLDECPEVVLVDFGPGRACHFVYAPGPGLLRAKPKGQPRTTR
jgi:eukaryotic-like serine/threonine-protein kinase